VVKCPFYPSHFLLPLSLFFSPAAHDVSRDSAPAACESLRGAVEHEERQRARWWISWRPGAGARVDDGKWASRGGALLCDGKWHC